MTACRAALCPKCGGQGHVSKPPHVAGDVDSWVDYNTGGYTCPVCDGKGWLVALSWHSNATVEGRNPKWSGCSYDGRTFTTRVEDTP